MEAKCYLKYQKNSARKVGQVLNQVRGKTLFEAEQILRAVVKGSSALVAKAVRSAGANLSVKLGRKIDLNSVRIKTAYSNAGPMKHLKRYNAGPQGRAMPYKKNMCHLTVVVSDAKEA
ncbi:MAG: 50S ribosomal protein L22 [Elusimicrobia bacterium]|nr:50S ribosomal protein L22 [Elusimicrobiota bacterium]